MYFEHIDAIRKPGARGFQNALGGGFGHLLEAAAISVRIAEIGLAGGEDVGFTAKTAYALHAAHERGVGLRLHAPELLLGGSVFEEAQQLFIDRLFDALQIDILARGGDDDELAADLAFIKISRDLGCDLIVVDEAFVETRAAAGREHTSGEAQINCGRIAIRGHVPDFMKPRLRDAILDCFAALAGQLLDPGAQVRDGRPRRDRGEIAAHLFFGFARAHIAGQHEHCVRGRVVRLEPLAHVVEGGGIEVLHGADDGVRVGMADRVGAFDDQLLDHGVGLIIALALFVLHHAALQIEHFLIDGVVEMPHAVGFGEQREIERGGWDIFEVIGAVLVGGAVKIGGADPFHHFDVTAGEMLAAAEHQMFKEMREAGFSRFFVFRSDVIPEVQGHYWRLAVFMDENRQSVIQDELLAGNFQAGRLHSGVKPQDSR